MSWLRGPALFRFPPREPEAAPWVPVAKAIIEGLGGSYEAKLELLPYLKVYLGEPEPVSPRVIITFEELKAPAAEAVVSTRELKCANVVVKASSPFGFLRALRLEPVPFEWVSPQFLGKAQEAWRRRGHYPGRFRVFSDGLAPKEEEELKGFLGTEVMFARPGEVEPGLEIALLATSDIYIGGESFHTGLAAELGLRGVVRGPRELARGNLLPQGNLKRLLKEMGLL